MLFPKQVFVVRWFYFIYRHVTFDIPAYVYFGFWILLQLALALMDIPGVAWWAHLGGFLAGLAFGYFWREPKS